MVKHAAGSATSLDPVTPLLGDTGSSAPSQVPAREYLDLTKDVRDEGAVQLLREILTTARKIVVIAGAGISVAAGIPDFRGSKGMFATMKAKGRTGQSMFDSSVYRSPETILEFHEMTCSLYEASRETEPTPFHNLLESLAKSDRLLRLYTQNIDFLDTRHETLNTVVPVPPVGPWPKVIAVHGSLEKMTCTKCQIIKDFNPALFRIWKEDTPECNECRKDEDARIAAGRRRLGIGFIRPRMVLYGEPGYDDLNIGSCMASDLRNRPDTLIVVGTTLKIPGTRTMVKEMSKAIGNRGHVIWLNVDDAPTGEFSDIWDFVVKGDCQEVARLMENVTIPHKDQSFVCEDIISASQQTIKDLDTSNQHNPKSDWWSVVVNDNMVARHGMLTPASTNPSCSDDEKSIQQAKSSLSRLIHPDFLNDQRKKSTSVIPTTTNTADFYAPLAGPKTKTLKRKLPRIETEQASKPKAARKRKPSFSQKAKAITADGHQRLHVSVKNASGPKKPRASKKRSDVLKPRSSSVPVEMTQSLPYSDAAHIPEQIVSAPPNVAEADVVPSPAGHHVNAIDDQGSEMIDMPAELPDHTIREPDIAVLSKTSDATAIEVEVATATATETDTATNIEAVAALAPETKAETDNQVSSLDVGVDVPTVRDCGTSFENEARECKEGITGCVLPDDHRDSEDQSESPTIMTIPPSLLKYESTVEDLSQQQQEATTNKVPRKRQSKVWSTTDPPRRSSRHINVTPSQ